MKEIKRKDIVMQATTKKDKNMLFILGVLLRIGFLVYGTIQDLHPVIKFTDIDYSVFTDAAGFILQNQSPYNRSTYRYTPLLSWLMVPNHFNILFGKILFSACDLMTGVLIFNYLESKHIKNHWNLTAIWVLNPFVAGISTRGNAESVMAFLVILSFYLLSTNRLVSSAIVYGISVHFKIYPIIYCIPFWFGIDHCMGSTFQFKLFSKSRILFGLISATTFFVLGFLMYKMYNCYNKIRNRIYQSYLFVSHYQERSPTQLFIIFLSYLPVIAR
jgi:phosphatidylinositol glycan class M